MSVGIPSDEVAEDYKNSLEDLTANSRYEISNLTVIARENTEHAMAISRVLENHIKSVPPDRKLPALYVLDSVVKNVGTPYTLFLGRNLFNTFMGAYLLVNQQTRRKLDEMLKTWKEPVPGSQETRPVFPHDTTRQIETALLKARTSALQQQQQHQFKAQQEMTARGRPMPTLNTQWRNTPTPPQANGAYYPPPPQGYSQRSVSNGNFQSPSAYPPPSAPRHHPPQPDHQQSYQQPYPQPPGYPQHSLPPQNLDSLKRDIADLIGKTKAAFASSPYDDTLRIRLQALLDLQNILNTRQLPSHEIQAIRDQVAQLSGNSHPPSVPPPYVPPPLVPQQQPPPRQSPAQGPTPQPGDLQALLSSRNLADIIAKAQRSTSTPPATQTPYSQPQQVPTSYPPVSSGPGTDLMAMLRAQGLLRPNVNIPTNGPLGYVPPRSATNTPPVLPASLARPPLINDVEITSASLKLPRPHLISTLYEARPNQCSTCGRRFFATEDGREKKARHLDWHFRTNQRLADSAKRGQSRSWYVDELEWIKSRDNPEDTPLTDASSAAAQVAFAASLAAADPKKKHIPAPADPTLANQPCPICQEKFATVWNDEEQEFVWMDAIKLGNRVYHASCHAEIKKDGGSTPLRTSTPDSVLGKRKSPSTWFSEINANNAKAFKP
ncbi:hypothetical protein ABVK25_007001 [Lepraria finkii]|uniref:CID domain-containing protein n=1 Tax=Lepraria finkii TaxID=1340010 RepID=A0ABR4B6U7_9LECA